MQFHEWFSNRDDQTRRLYASENPEPEEWAGFYAGLSDE